MRKTVAWLLALSIILTLLPTFPAALAETAPKKVLLSETGTVTLDLGKTLRLNAEVSPSDTVTESRLEQLR